MKKEIKIQVPISNENIAKTDTVFIPRSKFHTLLSNNITNESFYNLKQMSLFDPEKDEHFELERLIKIYHNFYRLSMEDMNNIVFSKLDEWKGKRKLVDDTAIFSCRLLLPQRPSMTPVIKTYCHS